MSLLESKRVSSRKLEAFCAEALVKSGMSTEHAKLIADVLVTTDTWGIHTHGSYQLLHYVQKINAGGLDPKAVPEVTSEGPGWATIHGHDAHAMVSSCMAMRLAIEKAAKTGLAFVGVKNSYHFGAAAYYAHMAVQHDQIGFAMSNVAPFMAVPGARGRVIGNNPFAYAAPAGQEPPVVLDIAMSVVAGTKIEMAKRLGNAVPAGWMVDEEGIPTTDSSKFPDAMTLLPIAGHKGYGLAMMVEILGAVLTGAGITSGVIRDGAGLSDRRDTGHSFLAINIDAIMPIQTFKQRMDKMIRQIKNSPKAKGAERIYLPGEMEWEKREVALQEGIALPQETVANLTILADLLGLDIAKLI